MRHRVNSAIHLGSAVYSLLMLLLILLFVPNALYTRLELAVLTLIGIGIVLLDTKAGIEQWRRPASGNRISLILHLGVAVFIVALLTFDYQMAQPIGIRDWFKQGDFWFLALLGVVRAIAGAAMLHHSPVENGEQL